MKSQVPAEAIAAWARGEKVEAVRIAREHAGLGLMEATQALESSAYAGQTVRAFGANLLPAEAAAAAVRGDLIQAIKLTRQATGLGLKEAKELVEQSRQTSQQPKRLPFTPSGAGLAPGEVPRRGPAGLLVAVLSAIAAAILVYIYRG